MKTPATIPECFEFLDALVDEPYKEELKRQNPEDLNEFNKNLRQYIQNSWLYDESSPLLKTFRLMDLSWTSVEEISAYLVKVYREYLLGSIYNESAFKERFMNEVRG